MEITIHEEKISHFTFHGEKKGPITSHENTLYHPLLNLDTPRHLQDFTLGQPGWKEENCLEYGA